MDDGNRVNLMTEEGEEIGDLPFDAPLPIEGMTIEYGEYGEELTAYKVERVMYRCEHRTVAGVAVLANGVEAPFGPTEDYVQRIFVYVSPA